MSVLTAQSVRQFTRDPTLLDRREGDRVAIELTGRYMLSTKRDQEGKRREFACRALDISLQAIQLIVPVTGPVGERVIAYFDEFGVINGQILRVTQQGMVMSVIANDKQRERLAAKLAWLKEHQDRKLPDARQHRRVVPRRPLSTLTLATGETATCLVIDMSVSGVAISADMVPPIGAVVAIGAVVGRVKRHFAEGFAVAFVETQDLEQLERLLMLQ
jgi:hypothetical protein